ncbi:MULTISPECIES: FAD-dependent monooxygenase [unclassified Streptomyces]|uniref:FAD-dependent monooxygenase n=1 Tax=unclassified Streptomyces TaxID=2593676 RepID=UPI00343DEF47
MDSMSGERVPALIVGGAYTGLSTALGLAFRGIRPLLVERRATTTSLPKAWGLNPRTAELLGTFPGMTAALRDAQQDLRLPQVGSGVSLSAPNPVTVDLEAAIASMSEVTPAMANWLPQSAIEKIMRAASEDLGADLRFSTELVSFSQDADGVTAMLRDVAGDREYTVTADYLVAADGHASPIRNSLGIELKGGGKVGHLYVITFTADLSAYIDASRFAVFGIPGSGTSIISDGRGAHTLWVDYFPERGETGADFTEARCLERVRHAIGIPDLACEIVNARPFALHHQLAERFRQGRVLLAGDAAHTCPPVGGQGGNLAIQDGYDLAWRLALVQSGQAGQGLLDTYTAERRPVINITLEREVALLDVADGRILSTFDASQPVPTLQEILGFRYHSAAIRTEPGDDLSLQEDPAEPTGRPGCRAPHVPLSQGERLVSTHDLFGRGFVLLAGPDGVGWIDAARNVADRLEIDLTTYRLGDDLDDSDQKWAASYGVAPDGASLVRPDAVIAWRSKTAAANPDVELQDALTAILAR